VSIATDTGLETLAFIGTGNMGRPMSRRLLEAGFGVEIYDCRRNNEQTLVANGATVAGSAGATVERGGVVISMVPDDQALREVSLDPGGVLERLGTGGIHVSMSTISPRLSDELTDRYRLAGNAYVAAPVLGRPDAAAAGRLSILIAGDPDAKRRVMPAMEAIGAKVADFGERPAAASAAKVTINFLILAVIEAMAEAGGLADRAGVDRERLFTALLESSLFGGAVCNGYGRMIAEHAYTPALFRVALGIKDATLAEELAAEVEAELPIVSLAREHLERAEDAGWGAEDWAVIGRVLAGEPAAR
jgi:3-hydroxyisobutyrate dehydrogenase-like beta-hydroxyacid dehydrogenase